MNNKMQTVLKDAYKAISLYREALTNAFLQGHISLEVKTKSDLFFTATAFERMLSGYEPTESDLQYIDKECAELDITAELYPNQLVYVYPQLEAVGKTFEAIRSLNEK